MDNQTLFCYPVPDHISWLTFLIDGVTTNLLVLFGLCGNYRWFRTLWSANGVSRWGSFLLMLCVWDSTLLCSTMGFYSIAVVLKGRVPWNGYFAYFYIFFYPVINTTMTGSLWTILAISIERYVALSRPLIIRTARLSARGVCVLVVLSAVMVNLPTVAELKLEHCWSFTREIHLPQIAQTKLRLNKNYIFVYRVICYLILFSPVPFVVILVLTVRTLVIRREVNSSKLSSDGLMKRNQVRRRRTRTVSDHTAALLTSMVLKFLICYTPPTLMNILECIDVKISHLKLFAYFAHGSNLLVVAQSATNWLIYYQWRAQTKVPRAATQSEIADVRCLSQWPDPCAFDSLWQHQDPHKLSAEIIRTVLFTNPSLRRHFASTKPETKSTRVGSLVQNAEHEALIPSCSMNRGKIEMQCEIIGSFLARLTELMSKGRMDEAKKRVRFVGRTHRDVGVKLRVNDFVTMKKLIRKRLMDTGDEEDNAAAHFATFLIAEMRNGYLCRAVEAAENHF